MKHIFILAALLLIGYTSYGQEKISAKDASKFLNHIVSICDSVYSSRDLGSVTVFNVGGEFPNQAFSFVILKKDLANFTNPIDLYSNKKICLTGKMVEHKGKPQIVVNEPKQVEVNKL